MSDVARQLDFEISHHHGDTFGLIRHTEEGWDFLGFDFNSSLKFAILPLMKRVNRIEELLFDITKKTSYIESHTIQIKYPGLEFGWQKILSKEQLEPYLVKLKEELPHISDQANSFNEPKRILALWESLHTQEEKTSCFFTPFQYCHILVVSKLANDPSFPERAEQSRAHYEKLIAEGKNYGDKLKTCDEIIQYFEKQ